VFTSLLMYPCVQFRACDAKRAALLEETTSLKGAIRVMVRVRPPLPGEVTDAVPLLGFPDARDDASVLELVEKPGAGVGGYGIGEAKRHRFDFQRVFTPLDGQDAVFAEVEGVIQSSLVGRRVCLFAYGQTGSGKTHTMVSG